MQRLALGPAGRPRVGGGGRRTARRPRRSRAAARTRAARPSSGRSGLEPASRIRTRGWPPSLLGNGRTTAHRSGLRSYPSGHDPADPLKTIPSDRTFGRIQTFSISGPGPRRGKAHAASFGTGARARHDRDRNAGGVRPRPTWWGPPRRRPGRSGRPSGGARPSAASAPPTTRRIRSRPEAEPGAKGSGGAATGRDADEAGEVYGGLGTWIDIYDDEAWGTRSRPSDRWSTTACARCTCRRRTTRGTRRSSIPRASRPSSTPPGGTTSAWSPGTCRGSATSSSTCTGRSARSSSGPRTGAGSTRSRSTSSPGGAQPVGPDPAAARALRADPSRGGDRVPARRDRRVPHRLKVADPGFWPSFPWRRLAGTYDVFLPMTYYTYRVHGPRLASWYTAQSVQIIRQETSGLQVPIHVVGGISFDATGGETRGFVQTVRRARCSARATTPSPGSPAGAVGGSPLAVSTAGGALARSSRSAATGRPPSWRRPRSSRRSRST